MAKYQKEILWDLFRTTGKIEYFLKLKELENKTNEETI